MQPAPKRLQHAIWSAFRAARPASSSGAKGRPGRGVRFDGPLRAPAFRAVERRWPSQISQSRFYGDKTRSDLDKKIEDAHNRIDRTIESKANSVINPSEPEQDTVKSRHDETIIHTHPEASSIVYDHGSSGENAANAATEANRRQGTATRSSVSNFENASTYSQEPPSESSSTPLPSQVAAGYSRLRERFTDFMDNFQTHVFTASKRLNDLTGYSSIERLKKDIEQQESFVREARQLVKDSRSAYQQAVTTRSDTQREVNDLLHRKHAWSSQDLERFTNLYRSDHANEQAEQKAHTQLSQAEAAYEEASARLSKGILARYHEEQVWSDKIRQMSTWGTWGLMGLNVLLFVVFQILVEPWRRRRLVRGFEEKVQEALKEQSAEQELRTLFHVAKAQEGMVAQSTSGTEEVVALTGEPQATSQAMEEIAQQTALENAAEAVTLADVAAEDTLPSSSTRSSTETAQLEMPPNAKSSNQIFDKDAPSDRLESLWNARYRDMPFLLGVHTRRYFESMFDETSKVSISQRDLTAKMLEGAFMGAMGVVCFFWIAGVSSHRVR